MTPPRPIAAEVRELLAKVEDVPFNLANRVRALQMLESYARDLEAMEKAKPSGWLCPKCNVPTTRKDYCPRCICNGKCGGELLPLYTRPASNDAVRALVAKWKATTAKRGFRTEEAICANELEAALAQDEGEKL